MTRVSIGLPVYNGERYLAEALESILAQTYTDFELIIADNASTDSTQSICEKYCAEDKRIHYSRNSHNLGAAPNFNRTFERATGEYFKWFAYDDIVATSYLARCVEALDEHPEIVLCQTAARVIDAEGKPSDILHYDADIHAVQPHHRFGNIALVRANTAVPVFGVIRSDILGETGLIGSYPSSDVVLLAELSLYGQFLELDEPLFYWRVHNEQSTQGVNTVERDRVAWFDTAAANRVTLPKWQYLQGYMHAISTAPINKHQRAGCYLKLFRWLLVPDHFRAMGKDILLAGASLVERKVENWAWDRSHTKHVSN